MEAENPTQEVEALKAAESDAAAQAHAQGQLAATQAHEGLTTASAPGAGGAVTAADATMRLNGQAAPELVQPNMRALAAGVLLTVRAHGTLAAGAGPTLQLRRNGVLLSEVRVNAVTPTNYSFTLPALLANDKIDLVYIDDAVVNGQDRNLFISYIAANGDVLLPSAPGITVDRGVGPAAFDGVDVIAGQGGLYWSCALRVTWPSPTAASAQNAARSAAFRLLQQGTFGPRPVDLTSASSQTPAQWLAQQLAQPAVPSYVQAVEARYALGDAYRPGGTLYDPGVVERTFWSTAHRAPDQLRRRMGFALHQIFMVSLEDSNLWYQSRAYAHYLDTLNRLAFGNYRTLLEEVALSPAMGIYLSHMRNRKEDPTTGRTPDENFARELMQLFTIGLHELNVDGTAKLGPDGQPIETYNNDDVMALAKVFTGWSWAFPNSQLTEQNFRWSSPSYKLAEDTRIDLQRLKPYPSQHSSAEKRLFFGKPHELTIPRNGSAQSDLKLALDALFNHPNVGPFIAKQLIQRLVTSQPGPAYVARVANAFNNNGQGVRGDLTAVVRAVLLDPDARAASPAADFGKLREPVLRVTQWMRAFDATSSSGHYKMEWALDSTGQRPHAQPQCVWLHPPWLHPAEHQLQCPEASGTRVPAGG